MYLNENKVSQSFSLTHGRSPFPPHNIFRSLLIRPERKRNDAIQLGSIDAIFNLKTPRVFV